MPRGPRGKKKVSDSPVVAVAKQFAALSPDARVLAQEIAAMIVAVRPKPAAAQAAEVSVGDVIHKAERRVRGKAKKVRDKVVAAESKGSSQVKPAGGLTNLIGRGRKQAAAGSE